MSKLLCVVPSRGRPDNIKRLRDTMAETCRGDTTLVVGLDEDDPTREQYPKDVETEVRFGLRRVVAWTNALAMPRVDDYDYVGHFGDDNVPRTVGWDVNVMAALEKTPFAFCNDLYPGRTPGTLCCHVFTRSSVLKALGYFGPPSIQHMYVDVVWMAWGVGCGITYLHNDILEHMHYTAGKSPCDQSYWESTSLIPADLLKYQEYVGDPDGLNADIIKIARVCGKGATFNAGAVREFNRGLNIPLRAREGWQPGTPLW